MPTPKSHLDLSRNHFLNALQPLREWASQPHAEQDLECVFGAGLNWSSAFKHLAAFRSGDFTNIPPVTYLPPSDMPGLWGAYSRDLQHIFLSTDCPANLLSAVLIEEIGHFLDQEFCMEETPGDEGAHFAKLVLGSTPTASDLELWNEEESASQIHWEGSAHLVEAAAKVRGSGTAKTRGGSKAAQNTTTTQDGSVVYANTDSVRIAQANANQRVIGSRGNDTFVVMSQNARLEDPNGGTDTVETKVNFSLKNYSFIENLTAAAGTAAVTLGGNYRDNVITGNSGNNSINGETGKDTLLGGDGDDTLDGGNDSTKDSLVGGNGNDNYVIRDTLDSVVEASSGGDDTIETTIANYSLSFANVENVTYIGTGSATLVGNKSANKLTGGKLGDTLFGGSGTNPIDTLAGGEGNDVYYVSRQSDVIVEKDGATEGTNDTIITSAASYTMAALANVETLIYKGLNNSSLTGNSGNNSIFGAFSLRNTIDGASGNDYLVGGSTTDSLIGGAGNDTLLVTPWADSPVGGLGNTLRAGLGSDILNGGLGDDWYVVNSQTAYTFQEVAEYTNGKRTDNNTIASTVNFSLKYNPNIASNIQSLYLIGNASLQGTGSDNDNSITGNDGSNSLAGEAGNDSILGGLGADFINGGTGDDTLVGGGRPQTDIPANASTPIDLAAGQYYESQIETRQDTDWIRVSMTAGATYYFRLEHGLGSDATLSNSDVAFGVKSYDFSKAVGTSSYDKIKDLIGLIGDSSEYGVEDYVLNFPDRYYRGVQNHSQLVLDSKGEVAPGIIDESDLRNRKTQNGNNNEEITENTLNNIRAFSFTAFKDGEFYIPVTGVGPLLGSYTVFCSNSPSLLPDPSDLFIYPPPTTIDNIDYTPTLADTESDILIGGMGADSLVGLSGRDKDGNYVGDTLLGGTNGIPGIVDSDNSIDTLIGGIACDLLDGGRGADSMVGGGGNDTYFIDNVNDKAVEEENGGVADLAIFGLGTANRTFATDLTAGYFTFGTAASSAGLDSTTGQGFDVDLKNVYANIEHASLMGSANLYVLGNGDPNSLTGNFGNNLLVAAAGDDTLMGEGGNDYLVGGDGGDLLDGGSGINTMDGGLGSDTYIINDRTDRIINEIAGFDGGVDLVRTYFNFDPIQGTALEHFQPDQPDNSPSTSKAPSFASRDIKSFYNLEQFELLGQAVYGVGNALGNTISAGPSAALLLGMGGNDSLVGYEDSLGGAANDTLYGDTPDFYASPDIYAPAPTDTRTQEFLDSVIGDYGSDYLYGGGGDDYLDGGKGADTMSGGAGSDTFIQDHVDEYIIASDYFAPTDFYIKENSPDELISSVNIAKAPDGISKLMLVVKAQDRDANGNSITGQDQVASFASFLGTQNGNDRTVSVTVGALTLGINNANDMELMYSVNKAEVFQGADLSVGLKQTDLNNPGKVQFELSWTAAPYYDSGIVGYTVEYKSATNASDIWHTYVNGTSQDFKESSIDPSLTVTNLDDATYNFRVTAQRLAIPVQRDANGAGDPVLAQHVTLQGGGGNDGVFGLKLTQTLHGGLVDDALTLPLVVNNPIDPLPLGFIFNPEPYNNSQSLPLQFATYLDGSFGNDILCGAFVNDRSGNDYAFQGVSFKGLNTLVGGQGSDTFVVNNGGTAIGDEFDWVVKYGNETPVDFGTGGIGNSLNGGQHNLVVSTVPFLTLSDTIVSQGKFIDQLGLSDYLQFGMGNRLDNYIYDGAWVPSAGNTLVGNTGRDSIVGHSSLDVLIGGTAYGLDNVRNSIYDFADIADGGNGLTRSIFRDSDPIPEYLISGPGAPDPSQFWFVPGYYGQVFDASKNVDTLVGFASDKSGLTLDGGAGADSLVGSATGDTFYCSGSLAKNALFSDYIVNWQGLYLTDIITSNGGGDTVVFTDSDNLWWSGYQEGDTLPQNGYKLAEDAGLSGLILQRGSPTARIGLGNAFSNAIKGNEFDNSLAGRGVGGNGIDVLVGDAIDLNGDGEANEGYLSSDNFIVDDLPNKRYRDAGTWKPEIKTTDISITNPITGVKTPQFQHDWDSSKSVYLDQDFVVIQDFEIDTDTISAVTGVRTTGGGNADNLVLSGALTDYSIGNLPSSEDTKNLGSIGVGPNGKTFSGMEFGIYYTGAVKKDPLTGLPLPTTIGSVAPNLVAVIRSTTDLLDITGTAAGLQFDTDFLNNGLDPTCDLVARNFYTANQYTTTSAVAPETMGWGQFYELSSSNFAQYVSTPGNNTYGGMATSTAELSVLVNTIV